MKNSILIVALCIYFSAMANAEMKNRFLTKNPFVKPENVFAERKQEDSKNIDHVSLNDRNLRATLKSSDRSIANIDGIMVFEGEVVKGYTLISVGEGSATFIKNGEEITLNVSELHKKLKK